MRRQIELASQRRYAELLSEFGGSFRRPWYNWLLRARLVLCGARLADEMNAPDEFTAYLRAGLAEGLVPPVWLSRITARTLVIGGTHDQFFGQRMRETANAIEGARIRLFPGETHMAPLERAAAFRREIATFLAASGRYKPDAGLAVARCTISTEQEKTADV